MRTHENTGEQLGVNEYLKNYDDFATWTAEALDGSMRTSFDFVFDGRELYGRDGRALGIVFENAVEDARQNAARKPNLLFEYRRRLIEMEEYEQIINMARGDAPNTMVVVSDYPPELMESRQSIGGYNAARKQTFLRIITANADGKINISSQTLDQSNRAALQQIYAAMGVSAGPGELLGQRVQLDLQPEEQPNLIDRLTGVYDRQLSELYGGEWRAGRKPADWRNTYKFANAQSDLIRLFVDSKMQDPAQAETLRYGIMAAMQKRFELSTVNNHIKSEIESMPLTQEIHMAAQIARAKKMVFAGCGITLGPSDSQSSESELSTSGYGNNTKEGSEYKFDKKMHCVVCQSPPSKSEPQKWCGPCGICKECDVKLRKK